MMEAGDRTHVQRVAARLQAAARDRGDRHNPYHHYIRFHRLAPATSRLTGWPLEARLRCGLQAVEITAALAAATSVDPRSEALGDVRIDHLLDSVTEQLRLLARVAGPLPPVPAELLVAGDAAPPSHLLQLAGLGATHRARLVGLTGVIAEAFRDWPAGIGLERAANHVLEPLGLPAIPVRAEALDYATLADPELVADLNRVARCGAEDHLFASTHQVVECWLAVAIGELESAIRSERDGHWPLATRRIRAAAAVLQFLARHLSVFDEMVLVDYHELRVRLKGSSGAQSAAAHRTAALGSGLLAPLQAELAARGHTLYRLQRAPAEHVELYQVAEAVAKFDSALASFFFQHYVQAMRVQGSQGIGALGQGTLGLVARFMEPVRAEIDRARCDHIVVSNLQYADVQGTLVMEGEAGAGAAAPSRPARSAS